MVDLAKTDFASRHVCRTTHRRVDVLTADEGVTAWRFWHTARPGWPDGSLIAPIGQLDIRKPRAGIAFERVTEARCLTTDHPAPHYKCRCGIRGMYDLTRLVALLKDLDIAYAAYAVIGRVRLYGRMQNEAAGDDWHGTVRGQYAAIDTTMTMYASPALETEDVGAVERRYGVEVLRGSRDSVLSGGSAADCIHEWLDGL